MSTLERTAVLVAGAVWGWFWGTRMRTCTLREYTQAREIGRLRNQLEARPHA